jgi:anti-sigma B factor antagonist
MPESNAGPLTIHSSAQGSAHVVAPAGEIDLGGSPMLRAELKKRIAPGVKVVVDLAGVPYMDSSGLATLVEALQGVRRAGGGASLVVCGLTPRVRSIFQIAKLEMVFTIVADRAEALAR